MISVSPPGQRGSGPWRESNPHLPGASRPSSRWTTRPFDETVTPVGVEPTTSRLRAGHSASRATRSSNSSAGGSRTHRQPFLKRVALPVCVPRHQHDVRGSNPPGLVENQATSPEVERRIGQSARRESNPPHLLGKQTPGPLGHGHLLVKTAEGGGVEPSRACGLALCSTQVPSPIGLPFRSPSLLTFLNGDPGRL